MLVLNVCDQQETLGMTGMIWDRFAALVSDFLPFRGRPCFGNSWGWHNHAIRWRAGSSGSLVKTLNVSLYCYYMILYAIIALPAVSPFPRFPRFLLTSTAHMPMADRCTVMAFADPWFFRFTLRRNATKIWPEKGTDPESLSAASHCESLWVTGHEANPAWNWVGLGPQPEGRKISIKLAHDKSQTKTPHTSPYCIPYTGWWVVFRVTFRSAPFSLFESLLKVSESGQSGWAMVSSDLRIKHAAA